MLFSFKASQIKTPTFSGGLCSFLWEGRLSGSPLALLPSPWTFAAPPFCFWPQGRLSGLAFPTASAPFLCPLTLTVIGNLHKCDSANSSFLISDMSILSMKLMFKTAGLSRVAVRGLRFSSAAASSSFFSQALASSFSPFRRFMAGGGKGAPSRNARAAELRDTDAEGATPPRLVVCCRAGGRCGGDSGVLTDLVRGGGR